MADDEENPLKGNLQKLLATFEGSIPASSRETMQAMLDEGSNNSFREFLERSEGTVLSLPLLPHMQMVSMSRWVHPFSGA